MTLALSSPALAQNVWIQCDGYGAATRGGDGMTEYAPVLLIFNPPGYGTTARSQGGHGQQAIAGCDQALRELPEAHWRRKVNLLQARALHRLETDQADAALADLDLANAAAAPGQNDPLFQRSQQLGLTLVRALALQRKGANDEAKSLLSLAAEQRPYDPSIQLAMQSLARLMGHDDLALSAMQQTARFLPPTRVRLAWADFDQGRFEEFLALHPHTSPPFLPGDNTLLPVETALRDLTNHEASAQFKIYAGVTRAYALTALGRHDEAEAAMAETRAVLAAHRQPPAPPRLRGPALEQYNEERALTLARIEKQGGAIADMARAIAKRRQAGEGRFGRLAEMFGADPVARDATGADTLVAAAEFLPPLDAAQARKIAADLRIELAGDLLRGPDFNSQALFEALPAPETSKRLDAWIEAKRPFLAARTSFADTSAVGYRNQTTADGLVTVRYRSATGTRATTEEMALLRAAELARQAGRSGFYIVARRDTAWTTGQTHMGMTLRTDPAGFESELDVRFVDADHPGTPALLVFNAEQVYANLAPIYIRTE